MESSVLRLLSRKHQLNMFPPSAKSSKVEHIYIMRASGLSKNYTIRLNVCFVFRTKRHS